MTVRDPIARIVIPRWVRVLAFLRVPFAVRRVRSARYLEWYLQKNQEAIVRGATDRMMEMLLYGSVDTGEACSTCGARPSRRFTMATGAWCQSCWEKRPRFYGPGVAEVLGIKKDS